MGTDDPKAIFVDQVGLTPRDYVTLNNLEAENTQLREDNRITHDKLARYVAEINSLKEQLQVEQINHRQTIDRYSDEVGELKEQLTEKDKIIELLHEANRDLDDVCVRLANAEAKVEKMRKALVAIPMILAQELYGCGFNTQQLRVAQQAVGVCRAAVEEALK